MVAAGFTSREILHEVQPGYPYPGWSLPQFVAFAKAVANRFMRQQVMSSLALAMGIGACFSKEGGQKLKQMIEKLEGCE